jgi:hypothetical protein
LVSYASQVDDTKTLWERGLPAMATPPISSRNHRLRQPEKPG